MKPDKKTAKAAALPAIRPNLGLQAAYQERLDALIKAMQADIMRQVPAAYEENPPEMAQDALPARTMRALMQRLSLKWQHRFDAAAPELAEYFSLAVADRSTRQLKAILRKAGFSVNFKLTAEVRDIVQATIGENVSLIKSIPSEHFTQIEGDVMRSVAKGGDLAPLAQKLEHQYGVTNRRAALIARDQNRKATATISRARQLEAGLEEAIWLHSRGGKTPRKSHVAYSGKRYSIREGALIDGERIWPGEKINCKCVPKPLLPGFS